MQRFLWGCPFVNPADRAYKQILAQLEQRTPADLVAWEEYPTGIQDCRRMVVALVEEYLCWPEGSVFLPDDPASVVFWDYIGDMDGLSLALKIEQHLTRSIPDEFWNTQSSRTFAEALAEMVS
jgi:hypothetical protein